MENLVSVESWSRELIDRSGYGAETRRTESEHEPFSHKSTKRVIAHTLIDRERIDRCWDGEKEAM